MSENGNHTRHLNGFSLLESLVVLLLTGIVAAAVQSYATALARNTRLYGEANEAEANASLALHVIAQDLRGAGFSPHGGLASQVQIAESERVVVLHDWNGDGDSADANERVGFQLAPNGRTLRRLLGANSAQPLIDGLKPHGARFLYFDASGRELVPPLSAAQRSLVRRIDVRLELALPCGIPPCAADHAMARSTSIHLRNG